MRKAQAQHGANEHARRALMGVEIDSAILRTHDGTRVYDEDDIPALLALTEIAILMERRWIKRISAGDLPSTAMANHYTQHGHRLQQGCCSDLETKKSFAGGATAA